MSKAKRSPKPQPRQVVLQPQKSNKTWWAVIAGILVLGLVVIVVAMSGSDSGGSGVDRGDPPLGVEDLGEQGRGHSNEAVAYDRQPPAGGDHFPAWQNCGVYDTPIPTGNVLHSMEHGAVWITYDPSISQTEIGALRDTAVAGYGGRDKYVILSPFPGNPAKVVATAWGRQLKVDDVNDPRIAQFITYFRTNPETTPEVGAACSGGNGTPIA